MILIIIVITAYIILSFAAFIIAEKKGRSGLLFFFLSSFLTPVIGLIFVIFVPTKDDLILNTILTTGSKTCPECRNIIPSNAKMCPYCKEKKGLSLRNKTIIIVSYCLLVIGIAFFYRAKIYTTTSPQSPASAFDDITKGDFVEPKLLKDEKPFYPRNAFEKKIEGAVTLQLAIGIAGNVESAEVLSVNPPESADYGLEKEAVDSALKWRFSPATRNGKPVKGSYKATVNFSLSPEEQNEESQDIPQ